LKVESKNYQRQRDSRPDIAFVDYQQLLVDKKNLEKELKEQEKETSR